MRTCLLLLCTFGALGAIVPATALAGQEAPAGSGIDSGVESPLMQSGGGEEAAEERAARLDSPEALAEDAHSRTEYSGYGRDAAIALAKRVFEIGESQSNLPQDQGSAKITGYIGEDAAAETLPGGAHLLLDSSMPLRSAQGSGSLAPVSLALTPTEAGYAPSNPLVPVVISKHVAEGASFQFGLRVAPVQHEEPEPSEVVGDSLFYPGTAKATDFLEEPAPGGLEVSWQILSAEGSSENGLHFTLPPGASLVASHRVTGAVEALLEGRRLLLIMPVEATAANGAVLPVSYSINGSTLTTHVDLSGNVDFPVMVDPLITQEYGGSSLFWSAWGTAGTEGAYFLGGNGNEGVLAGLEESRGNGAWAAREIYAPGWSTGEGSVARVDVRTLEHYYGEASHLETGIVGGEATSPIWTFNGTNASETHSGQLNTGEWIRESEHKGAAFCAVGAGGYDGGPTPLCNENYGGDYYHLSIYGREPKAYTQWVEIQQTWVKFLDTSKASASFNTEPTTAGGHTNALVAGGKEWFGPASNNRIEYRADDRAFGIETLSLQRWNGGSWETIHSNNYAAEGYCPYRIICGSEVSSELSYEALATRLSNGENKLRVQATDPSGVQATTSEVVLLVDSGKPYNFTVNGADVSGNTINITEGQAGDQITVGASEGENGVLSSGISTLWVQVDKHQEGGYEGSCYPGPCSAQATWTLNGRELGAGVHNLIVSAKNGAGWIQSAEYTLIVHAAAPVAIGPGSVNPESGDFALESTDVDLKDNAGDLTVTRHYDSQNVKEGAQGPLGPQWTIGLGELATLEVIESDGKVEGVMVAGPEGLSFFPAKEGGGYESPPGDSSLSLRLINNGKEYLLEDKRSGASTTFTRAGSTSEWTPTISRTSVTTNTLTDSYTTVEAEGKSIVEPTEELAPHSTAKCPSERGKLLSDEEAQAEACRALFFYYGSEDSSQPEAKGANESEWGWHANRLTKVVAVMWSTSAGKMEEEPVAEYSYDGQGRLRGEWDPRIKPALKTVYGYDSEGHVTAVSPPGQQPWLMTYGTSAEDASQGRLIKVTRPKASTALWNGSMPTNTQVPEISGTPAVGVRLAVSDGHWSNALAYGFQWEACNPEGQDCAPIPGAVNANYTPTSSNVYQVLKVQVSATNAGGTTMHASALSARVSSTAKEFVHHSQSVDAGNSINAVSCVPSTTDCVASDSNGNVFYSTDVSAKSEATWHAWTGPGTSPSEAVACPTTGLCLLADGSRSGKGGSLYYATSLGGGWSEAYTPAYGVDAIACLSSSLCVDGQDGEGYMRFSTKPASSAWTLEEQGAAAMTAASCVAAELCALTDSDGDLHVAPSASAIESDKWTQTDIDGSTRLTGVACATKTECLAVDTTGNVVDFELNSEGAVTKTTKINVVGSTELTGVACPSGSLCAMVDNAGAMVVANDGTETMTLGGDLTSVACSSSTLCLAAGNEGEVIAVDPSELASTKSEGAQQSAQPGATLEYDVPVSGEGAPYDMSPGEVGKWGQKDDPAEGFEVFPEEHSQDWPASGHAGATVYYMDHEAQAVNVANPSGGISTTEYEEGEVVRALTADNRERALDEVDPAEAAKNLSTVSKYNEEGDELSEVTGPEHKVKLANGEEVSARNHVRYFYDEGAPENEKGEVEEYGLVTKTTDGALLADGEEKDVRITLTGYSGQEGLGWTLHAATSTTVEPQGADLVSSTRYDKGTGVVEETRSPGGNAEVVSPPEPVFRFGVEGLGAGQMKHPTGVAVGPEGDVWVLDDENDRLEKFTSAGVFIGAYGSKGSGEGEFENPWGIAVNQKTGNVYVADSGNNRVEEFSSEGRYVRQWGSWGAEEGHFEAPVGIAIDGGGHVWVASFEDSHVQEFSETGEAMKREFGEKGKGAGQFEGLTYMTFSEGVLYVVDQGNKRVEEFSTTSGAKVQYTGQFGTPGKEKGEFEEPSGIAAAPVTGDLYVTDEKNHTVLEFTPGGKYLDQFGWWGNGENEFEGPTGVAVNATGSVYVADRYNNRISVWSQPEAGGAHMSYSTQFGSAGSGEGQFEYAAVPAVDSHGDVWVSDYETDHLQEFSAQGTFLASYGSEGEGNGQFDGMTGVAINQATDDIYVCDDHNHRIQELGPKGEFIRAFTSSSLNEPGAVAIDSAGNVWVTDMAEDQIQEFSATGSFLHAYGSKGSGELQFNEPVGITVVGSTVYVADSKNNRVEEISTSGAYIGQFSREGANGGEMEAPEGIVANSAGDLFVEDTGNDRIDEFSPSGRYLETIGKFGEGNGELRWPQGIAITAAGDLYVTDPGNHRVQKWAPDSQAVHDTKTIYYSPSTEASVEACQNKPQWAGLPCQTGPLAQPTDSATEPKGEQLPDLPVITTEYNMWLQPVKTIETIGSKTRTKTTGYEGERVVSQAVEAGAGKRVSPVHDRYSSTLGLLVEESQESEHEGIKAISQTFNTLGQLESYTDAEGNTTAYSYDQYGRATEVNYDATKLDHLADREMLRYQETTGRVTEVEDLGGEGTYKEAGTGAYKATYGVEGELLSETYPNDMTATYGYNSIGEGVSLSYTKNNHCSGSECEWFTDSLTPSVHGEAMSQKSSLASEQYRYEQPGRLAEVQEIPAGEDCVARIYAFNEEGGRTSLTTRKSGSGECVASEGGETERHTYDEANRNTDEGVQYESLGNITKLPAVDAGGHELSTEYYANGQVLSQTQDETTNDYLYDPEGRPRQTESIVKLASSLTVAHYPGPGGGTPAWTYNQTTGAITRNVVAFGGLAAVEEAGQEPLLQIRDLQGNVVGTAPLNETAGKPHTLERTTEYGVPTKEKPEDKYNWLGTAGITSNLSSGAVVQDGATYIPQLGATLQTQSTPEPAEVVNTITPGVMTVTSFIPLKYVEASAKSGAGGAPSGNLAEPEGEGRSPLMMNENLEESCSGTSACAGSYTTCKLTSLFGEPYAGELWLGAHVSCGKKVSGIQIDLCFYAWLFEGSKSNIANYKQFGCLKEGKKKGVRVYNADVANALDQTKCGEGETYRAWAWAYGWDGSYKWSSYGQLSGQWVCQYAPDSELQAGLEELLSK